MLELPSYLSELPPLVSPPVQTQKQELPFEELSWEDFERLIFRYVRSLGTTEFCHLYGKKGQAQEGIDIFARLNDESLYSVYQCKRYKKYTITNLKSAVNDFLSGEWASKTKTFSICCACSLNDKKLQDEIEKQAAILKEKQISLQIIDRTILSEKLKNSPVVVYDFFGAAWVNCFCGPDALRSIENRLDATQIRQFTERLGKIYSALFNEHERSITDLSGESTVPEFKHRYIIPNILSNSTFSTSEQTRYIDGFSSEQELYNDLAELDEEPFSYSQKYPKVQADQSKAEIEVEQSLPAEEWLHAHGTSIVVGGPGSGKSALLKYSTLELLGKTKGSDRKIFLHNKHLIPIWLPFGYWTSLVDRSSNTGITDCLKQWFKGMSAEDVWPLVHDALKDKRLLLLVDGLDEWTNESAAYICFQKLSVFIRESGISAIITTRKSGVEKFGLGTIGWQIGELAGLNHKAKEKLIYTCFLHKEQAGGDNSESSQNNRALIKTNELLTEITSNQHTLELASVPLLLYMLIHLKSRNLSLPHNKYKIYSELVTDLVEKNPLRRKAAAQIVSESKASFSNSEITLILSYIANKIHSNHPHGSAPIKTIQGYMENFLEDPNRRFGLSKRDSENAAEDFLQISESEVGIIVKTSTVDAGFFHRSLQEYLCAFFIVGENRNLQKEIIKEHFFDPQWREVILGIFALTQRNEDLEELLEFITEIQTKNDIETLVKQSLLAQVAFGDNECSAETAKNIAADAFSYIDNGELMPHRNALLKTALIGMYSNKLKATIQEKVLNWFPKPQPYPSYLFEIISQSWPVDDVLFDCLLSGISSGSRWGALEAAEGISDRFRGDPDKIKILQGVIKNTHNLMTRYTATYSVFDGWPNSDVSATLYNNLKKSEHAIARLLSVFYRSQNDLITTSDRKTLLELARDRFDLNDWTFLVTHCLQKHFADQNLLELCIASITGNREIDNTIATELIINAFRNHSTAIEFIREQILAEKSALISTVRFSGKWRSSLVQLVEIPELAPTIEKWAMEDVLDGYQVYRYIKSPKFKKFLLTIPDNSRFTFWHLDALLTNWGIKDKQVSKLVGKLLQDSNEVVSGFAHLMPKMLPDKEKCYQKLISLLEAPFSRGVRYDFIVQGLLEVANKHSYPEIRKHLLRLFANRRKGMLGVSDSLILYFAEETENEEVYAIIDHHIDSIDGDISVVAAQFKDSDEVRKKIKNKISHFPKPLRYSLIENLSKSNMDEFVFSLLSKYVDESDSAIKLLASIGYYESLLQSDTKATSLNKLEHELDAVGPNYESIRHSAVCGLIALKEGERLKALNSDEQNGINLLAGVGDHEPIFRYIAKNWTYLTSTLGPLPKLITGGSSQFEIKQIFHFLAPYVQEDDQLKNEFITSLKSGKLFSSDRIMLAASTLIPRHSDILQMCLHAIGLLKSDNPHQRHHSSELNSLIALNILERDFYASESLKRTLDTIQPDASIKTDKLAATYFATGLKTGKALSDMLEKKADQGLWPPTATWLVQDIKKPELKLARALKISKYLPAADEAYSRYFLHTMSTIISNDNNLVTELKKSCQASNQCQSKITLLMMLISSQGIDDFVLDTASSLYQSQRMKKFCEIVFDISTGKYLPSIAILSLILYRKRRIA